MTDSRVIVAFRVVMEGGITQAVFTMPFVLFKRAAVPTAVLSSPMVLNNSAAAPNAVLLVCGVEKQCSRAGSGVEATACVAKERIPTNCCVRRASGQALECLFPSAVVKLG